MICLREDTKIFFMQLLVGITRSLQGVIRVTLLTSTFDSGIASEKWSGTCLTGLTDSSGPAYPDKSLSIAIFDEM